MSHIDRLIDTTLGFHFLFMDSYPGYNKIHMSLSNAPKITFMTDRNNYYYEAMPFGLKNVGATYQRLMDMIFSSLIRINLEVYVDGMLVNKKF